MKQASLMIGPFGNTSKQSGRKGTAQNLYEMLKFNQIPYNGFAAGCEIGKKIGHVSKLMDRFCQKPGCAQSHCSDKNIG